MRVGIGMTAGSLQRTCLRGWPPDRLALRAGTAVWLARAGGRLTDPDIRAPDARGWPPQSGIRLGESGTGFSQCRAGAGNAPGGLPQAGVGLAEGRVGLSNGLICQSRSGARQVEDGVGLMGVTFPGRFLRHRVRGRLHPRRKDGHIGAFGSLENERRDRIGCLSRCQIQAQEYQDARANLCSHSKWERN